jgi:hypothetical protein
MHNTSLLSARIRPMFNFLLLKGLAKEVMIIRWEGLRDQKGIDRRSWRCSKRTGSKWQERLKKDPEWDKMWTCRARLEAIISLHQKQIHLLLFISILTFYVKQKETSHFFELWLSLSCQMTIYGKWMLNEKRLWVNESLAWLLLIQVVWNPTSVFHDSRMDYFEVIT